MRQRAPEHGPGQTIVPGHAAACPYIFPTPSLLQSPMSSRLRDDWALLNRQQSGEAWTETPDRRSHPSALFFKVSLALSLRHPLDGIAKHGARHCRGMPIQECHEGLLVAFADLSKHPSDRLVHQVFSIPQQHPGHFQGVLKAPLPDEV